MCCDFNRAEGGMNVVWLMEKQRLFPGKTRSQKRVSSSAAKTQIVTGREVKEKGVRKSALPGMIRNCTRCGCVRKYWDMAEEVITKYFGSNVDISLEQIRTG